MDKVTRDICRWFDRYAEAFYGQDRGIDANLMCKQAHCRRVAALAADLGRRLDLGPAVRSTAQLAGLLHDVGRFEQFAQYRTFMDAASLDHGAYGVSVLARYKVLDKLDGATRRSIQAAIWWHNKPELAGALSGQDLLVSKIVRDCDKLDIYRIVLPVYEGKAGHEPLDLGVDLPDVPGCSQAILDALCNRSKVHAARISTLNELKLMQLGWVYDINFKYTLESLARLRYLHRLAATIPDTDGLRDAKQAVLAYLDSALEGP